MESCSMEKESELSERKSNDELMSEIKNESDDNVLSNGSNETNGTIKLDIETYKKKMSGLPKFIMFGKEFLFDLYVEEKYQKKAENELRETPEVVAESLKTLRELIKGDENLVLPDLDNFYSRFLRPCKWYPDSAFRLIQRYYKFIVNYPYIMENLTPMDLKGVLTSDLLLPLPIRSKDGCRVMLINCGSKWKPKEYNIYELFRCTVLILEATVIDPLTQINGVEVIIDMKDLPLSHVANFTPKFAAIITEWVQKCSPCRLKHIHIVNQSFIFNMVFTIFKPFLSEKLRERIIFHGTNRENLINIIGKEALPMDYGGSEICIEPLGESFYRCLFNWQKEFEELHKYGYRKKE